MNKVLNTEGLVKLADYHFNRGQLDQALAICRDIIAVDNKNFAALRIMGRIAMYRKDYVTAADYLIAATCIKPDAAGCLLDYGVTLYHLKKYDKCIDLFLRSHAIDQNKTVANDLCNIFDEANHILREMRVNAVNPGSGLQFNICLGNFPRGTFNKIADLVDFIRRALLECGYPTRVTVGDVIVAMPGMINLFIDNFYNPEQSQRLANMEVNYGLIMTEKLTDDGVWGEGLEGGQAAYDLFKLVTPRARFVWCLLSETVRPCRRHFHDNVHYFPFGWLPARNNLPRGTPIYDFAMTGQLTPRRVEVIRALNERGCSTFFPGEFAPESVRDACLEGSRANLSIQKSTSHTIVSVARICQSLSMGVPVVLEHPDLHPGGVQDYCFTTTPNCLIDYCTEFAAAYPSDQADLLLRRFRDEMPMAPGVAATVEATVAGMSGVECG